MPDAVRPALFFRYIMAWMRIERMYGFRKFPPQLNDEATFRHGLGDGLWAQQLPRYYDGARTLGLRSANGRQAMAKFVMTQIKALESIIRIFGPLPTPGVPSGYGLETFFKPQALSSPRILDPVPLGPSDPADHTFLNYVEAYLAIERVYGYGKVSVEADDTAMINDELRNGGMLDTVLWGYCGRTKVLGIENTSGRQAFSKFTATGLIILETAIQLFGPLPTPGVPSGYGLETVFRPEHLPPPLIVPESST